MYLAQVVLSQHFVYIKAGLNYLFDEKIIPIHKGDLVLVPFGKNKTTTGIVINITVFNDDTVLDISVDKLKHILAKLNYNLPSQYIDLAQEISNYYFSPLQLSLRLFLPHKIWHNQYLLKTSQIQWQLNPNLTDIVVKGNKQKIVINLLKQNQSLAQNDLLFQADTSINTLKNLADKQIIQAKKIDITADSLFSEPKMLINDQAFKQLTPEQNEVWQSLISAKQSINSFLLHGITGSGKTEIFLHFFRWIFKNNDSGQCLFLVPEIALTNQMINYFYSVFTHQIAVIHSRISDNDKCKIWQQIHKGEIRLVIGSRSAIFMPWQNLIAIVIDEAHEWVYKENKAPRYNTKKIAELILSSQTSLDPKYLILASATPDIVDYYEAKAGKMNLLSLNKRVNNLKLPPVKIVDMRLEFKRQNYSPISTELDFKIKAVLARNKQVILFLNKRGYSQSLQCKECGHIVTCPNCEVVLTHHIAPNNLPDKLICHYCFLVKKLPDYCPHCHSTSIHFKGFGTQKIEEEITNRYDTLILRADRDTTTTKNGFKLIYEQMKSGKSCILLGTQMIAKGLDLANVELVGVLSADMGLHIPDFRSSEKVFQLLTQVAGRTGRHSLQGEVIFQTFMPEHQVIQAASNHNYQLIYEQEISSRDLLKYPPFSQIIKLILVSKDKTKSLAETKVMYEILKAKAGNFIIKYAPAFVPKINNLYYWHIIIRGQNPEQILKEINLDNWRIDRDPVFLG